MTTEIKQKETPTDPWSDLEQALEQTRAEFYSAFGLQPFGSLFPPSDSASAPAIFRAPRLDVEDTGTTYKIVADIPGIPKENLDIRVRGTSVEIRGENAQETEQKKHDFVHRERTYAGYYRAFEVPEPVVANDAKAKVANGVLELELPKVTPTPSQDEVKVAVQ